MSELGPDVTQVAELGGSTDNMPDDYFDPFLPSFETTVEEQSLQQSMDINKESLKRKLLLRRSMAELADQGIYPPLKTPLAFAEQRKHLERAKAGDMLRKKLTSRPDRQCLVQHHILEDINLLIDQSAQDSERQKKRSRLQEMLTDHLVHRPGPLDLVSANILKVDSELQNGVADDGTLLFGSAPDLDPTNSPCDLWTGIDDSDSWTIFRESFDSSTQGSPTMPTLPFSSSNDLSALCLESNPSTLSLATKAEVHSPTSIDFLIPSLNPLSVASEASTVQTSIPDPPDILPLLCITQSTSKPAAMDSIISRVPTPPDITPFLENSFKVPATFNFCPTSGVQSQPPATSVSQPPSVSKVPSSSRGCITKKSRAKFATKSKVIKFHEYRGPPGAQHSSQPEVRQDAESSPATVSYNIMLQQQQMLLQWQLQQQNRPFDIVPAPQTNGIGSPAVSSQPPAAPSVSNTAVGDPKFAPAAVSTTGSLPNRPSRLEDMKVADLKEACRRFNLSRSGPKPALIERLQPHASEVLGHPKDSGQMQIPVGEHSANLAEKMTQNVPRGATPRPNVPMEIDAVCKNELLNSAGNASSLPAQFGVVSRAPLMTTTALSLSYESQSNVSTPSSVSSASDGHNFSVLYSGSGSQHVSSLPAAPSVLSQPVWMAARSGINTPLGSQQTAVQVPSLQVFPRPTIPATEAKCIPENGISNTSKHAVPRMPQLIFVRPDAGVHGMSLANPLGSQAIRAPVPVQNISLGTKVGSSSVPVTSAGGNPSASSMFVFKPLPLLAPNSEPLRPDASVMPEKLPLSPEQLVIRQQQHILHLEQHLHQSQQELARAQQEARLRQLSSLDEASRSTSLFWRRPSNGSVSVSVASVSSVLSTSSNTACTPSVVAAPASAVNRRITSSAASKTADSKLRRSSTNPQTSFDDGMNAGRNQLSHASASQLITLGECGMGSGSIEDVFEVLMNNMGVHDVTNVNDAVLMFMKRLILPNLALCMFIQVLNPFQDLEIPTTSSNCTTSNGDVSFYLPDLGTNAMSLDLLSSPDVAMEWTESSTCLETLQRPADVMSCTAATSSSNTILKGNSVDISDWIDEFLSAPPLGSLPDPGFVSMPSLGFDFGDFDPVACNMTPSAFDNLLQMSTSK